ncbi:MAG: globin domain-containing protein [Paracoccaceae bacterium]
MHLTQTEASLVRQSLSEAVDRMDPRDLVFYEAFFRRVPEARALFRDDIAGQEMRFMTTLKVIVDNIGQEEALKPRYADLGREHALIGVKAEHFAPMGEALIETLRHVLGAAFTDDAENAWRKLYAQVSAHVIQKAGLA